MSIRLMALLLVLACLAACSSTPQAASSAAASTPAPPAQAPAAAAPTAASSNDAVSAKLHELAGSGATDCGRIKALSGPEVQSAADCALQAAKSKKPFAVGYDMPGLTVGIAGNAQGKLFSLSASPDATGTFPAGSIKTADCPGELRTAASGRVTCLPPGSMGMGSSGASPHAASPHGAMPPVAPGTPNPHAAPKTAPAPPTKTQ
jgi:hypothetical protein